MGELPTEVIELSKRIDGATEKRCPICFGPTPCDGKDHVEAPGPGTGGITLKPLALPTEVPLVFREIIKNDNRRFEIMSKGDAMTQAEWRELRDLNTDKKLNLRPSAEKALKWNTDKGDQPRAR